MAKRLVLGVLLALMALLVTGCEVEEEAEGPEPTPAVQATAGPTAQPATPEATPAPTTQPTQGMLGCPDCVKAGDQLKVTAADIQVGPDGKYYIPDRGDGCTYEQDLGPWDEVILRAPDCEVFWIYDPATGEVRPTIP